MKRQSSFPLFITKKRESNSTIFFLPSLRGAKNYRKKGNYKVQGQLPLPLRSERINSGQGRKASSIQGSTRQRGQHCCLIALDKETKSKAKGDFYKKYTTTKQQQGTRARHLPYRSGRKHQEQGRSNEEYNASRNKNLHPQKGHQPATSSGDNHHLCHTKAR